MKFLDDLDDNQLTISHRFHSMPILRTTPSDTTWNDPNDPSKKSQHIAGNFGKRRSDNRHS
jgi:hypothetical protein